MHMLNELAHLGLTIALALAVLGTVIPLVGAQLNRLSWMQLAPVFSVLQFLLVAFSFSVLIQAFIKSDFSLRVVLLNSHTLKPLIYKIAGVWGNHEGSLLLWVLILTLFAACAAWFAKNLPLSLLARVLGVQSAISATFLSFLLFTSNPFSRVDFPPFNGQGLNPLLQDPGLAFHPPFLYLGYVGLSVTFSFAIAALLEGKVDAAWARWVRPWTLSAWVFLTVGIGLGSWWAYYELGWGGFWFWDPVENASLMPWLISVALLHSAIVVEKRDALKAWTILLAILAFGFSLIGTFIVRSGVLTSVHAFANDPERGVFILLILTIFVGGSLLLFAFRAGSMESNGVFSTVSRESALVVNNLLLVVSCFVVFVGTVWPLIAELISDRKLSVGPPFFNIAFTPLIIGLAVILPIGSTLPWKRATRRHLIKLWPLIILCFASVGLIWAIQTGRSLLGPIGMGLGVWLILGVLVELYQRAGKGRSKFLRILRLPLADWGKATAHAGLGITICGVAGLTAWQVEDIRIMKVGERFNIAGFSLVLDSVEKFTGPNYFTTMATVKLLREDQLVSVLYPERRYYPVAEVPTTEAGIDSALLRDVYVVVGEAQPEGGYAVRTFIKPLANWIWAGAIFMGFGGLLSLLDRRYRVAHSIQNQRKEVEF